MRLKYSNFDEQYKAFIFELDDVLFPTKDYDLQVYYLFAHFLAYEKPQFIATEIIEYAKQRYQSHGNNKMFEALHKTFAIDINYQNNLNQLFNKAKLPLKLLLFNDALTLLKQIIVNHKSVFILTAGISERQLNKIKQTEWNGIETFLKVYFEDEFKDEPLSEALNYLLTQHNLNPKDIIMVGNSRSKQSVVEAMGISFVRSY
ncbi:MAG: hypothetical protein EAZ51_02610 [Sphingobacteriales bacterium]|nr:MAG: hypothetical protein EAZ64_03545 [Sphingobacteriales bacterium]TAF82439.1 MAG: hypothetical protein EAZ51_02610 [Sphingobacteriales bacterium]